MKGLDAFDIELLERFALSPEARPQQWFTGEAVDRAATLLGRGLATKELGFAIGKIGWLWFITPMGRLVLTAVTTGGAV